MTISMIQADRNFATPADDASLYDALAQYQSRIINRGNLMKVTIDGLVATVNTGQAIIQGRLVKITEAEQITLPASTSGNIDIVVDLTQTNTISGTAGNADYVPTINQVALKVVTGSSNQDDLNNGGSIYDFPIAAFTSTATTAKITSTHTPLDTGWVSLSPSAGKLSTTGTPGKLIYRLINNLFWLNCSGLLGVKQGATLFKIPTAMAPKNDINLATIVRQEGSSDGGSGIGAVHIDTSGNAVLTLTPSNSTTRLYDVWVTTNYPLQ